MEHLAIPRQLPARLTPTGEIPVIDQCGYFLFFRVPGDNKTKRGRRHSLQHNDIGVFDASRYLELGYSHALQRLYSSSSSCETDL